MYEDKIRKQNMAANVELNSILAAFYLQELSKNEFLVVKDYFYYEKLK